MTVVAVVGGEAAGAPPPHGVTTIAAASVAEARDSGAEFIWLLAGVPAPGALERLLAAVAEPGDPPLATGLAVDAAGRPVDRLTPRGKQLDIEALIAAAPDRRLPIRHAFLANTLVRRAAVDRHGLPRRDLGPHAAQEWTARLLAGGGAWLVPASVVTVPADAGPDSFGRGAVMATVRMARAGVWSRGDVMRGFAGLTRRTGARPPVPPGASAP